MTVVPFRARPYVVIYSGLVTETRRHHCGGVDVTRHDPPRQTFFVDLVEDGHFGVWDGDSYAAALAVARDCADDGIEIRDHTNVTWGRA